MPEPAPVAMSATLAADEAMARRRRAGEQVLSMTSGEIGLPAHPALRERLAAAADENAYGPVPGSEALRAAAAGYWGRRGLATDPALVVAGPGSKPLLFALLLAVGGDVVVPVPSWVSYAAQARLAGARPLGVPTLPGQGGVPDPERLHEAVTVARAAGRDPRSVVVTVPDNPTGTVASPEVVRQLALVARELDLVIISDEIYCDLVYASSAPAESPARHAPERTVVTTGLTKNLALGGWRTGVARLPDSELGRALHGRLVSIASQIWSSPTAPVQTAAAYAFGEPRRSPGTSRRAAGCTRRWCARSPPVSPRPAPPWPRSARPATSTRTSNPSGTTWRGRTASSTATTWPVSSPSDTASAYSPRAPSANPGTPCASGPRPAASTATRTSSAGPPSRHPTLSNCRGSVRQLTVWARS